MAIVAWQPGPNRYLQVPTSEEMEELDAAERFGGVVDDGPEGGNVYLLDDMWDYWGPQ